MAVELRDGSYVLSKEEYLNLLKLSDSELKGVPVKVENAPDISTSQKMET